MSSLPKPICSCGGLTTSLACRDAGDGGLDTDWKCLRCGSVQTTHEGPECFLPEGTWASPEQVASGLRAYVEAGGTSGKINAPYTEMEFTEWTQF